MGNYVTRTDFEWVENDEPHAKRRIEILSNCYSINNLTFKVPNAYLIILIIIALQKNIHKSKNCSVLIPVLNGKYVVYF